MVLVMCSEFIVYGVIVGEICWLQKQLCLKGENISCELLHINELFHYFSYGFVKYHLLIGNELVLMELNFLKSIHIDYFYALLLRHTIR